MSTKSVGLKRVALALGLLCGAETQAVTIGQFINPAEQFLECKSLNWYEQEICQAVAREVNHRLNEKGISFNNGDVVFRQDPIIAPQRVSTGHACTHKAWIEGSHAEVRFASSGSFTFNSSSVDEPQLLMLTLPVSVYARVGLREWWGYNLLGSCNKSAEDNYYADFSVNTTIRQLVTFSLEPKLLGERTAQGDYQIKIKPIFMVEGQLTPFSAQFGVHNRDNFFSGFMTYLTGRASFIGEGNLALYSFDAAAFVDALVTWGIDLVQAFGSPLLELDDNVLGLDHFEAAVERAAKKRINREYSGMTHSFEEDTYRKIAAALELDANGERTLVIKKEVVDAALFTGVLPVLEVLF